MELVSKKSRESKAAEKARLDGKADPAAGINDMMREMYENGDEATRKIIGEAMLKSREEQNRSAKGGGSKRKAAGGGALGGGAYGTYDADAGGLGDGFGSGLGGGLDDFGDL